MSDVPTAIGGDVGTRIAPPVGCDRDRESVIYPPNLEWRSVPLRAQLAERLLGAADLALAAEPLRRLDDE